MKSGIEYDIAVRKETENGTYDTIPFNNLSKSGKIVNAYNALLMAEEMAAKNN